MADSKEAQFQQNSVSTMTDRRQYLLGQNQFSNKNGGKPYG